MNPQRIILHVDMDYFFAQLEERENPHFKGRPVVVGADPEDGRGVVSTANYEARKYGIHSAQPITEAYRRCPQAVFLPINARLYKESSSHIMKILHHLSSLMEQVSIDEAYLDISYVRDFDHALEIAEEARGKIWEKERLTCSCGVAMNKMVSKLACKAAKPDGVRCVLPRETAAFVRGLAVGAVPGVGEKTVLRLRAIGVTTVEEALQLSLEKCQEVWGSRAKDMYDRFRGRDESPIVVQREVKSVGKEHTFLRDTRDASTLLEAIRALARQVYEECEREEYNPKSISVICRFTGFETHTKTESFTAGVPNVREWERKAIMLLLRFLTEYLKPVRLVGVRAKIAHL